jgi:hypothetical protein
LKCSTIKQRSLFFQKITIRFPACCFIMDPPTDHQGCTPR